MSPGRRAAAFPIILWASCIATGSAQLQPQVPLSELKTRAERTNYRETSRYDDVIAFLNNVDQASGSVHVTTFGYTFEGRSLPLAVVGRISDPSPRTVRASGKLRVYIQGNIHAGEVEGKEAAQALVRDIALGRHAEWLDSMVMLVAPIYNADGNERVSPTNRREQNGPIGGMGTRASAQGLNLNRDHMKLETPEARSMVRLLNNYDPHVMLDLHTTNGSRHAYYLTYEVPNNPAVDPGIAEFARSDWMPAVTRTLKSKYDWDYYFYGNVTGQGAERAWSTVEDRPRFSHNYWGLRNRFGILSETYSYATFPDRIAAVTRFLEEVLNFSHANASRVRQVTEEGDGRSLIGQRLSLRSRAKRSDQQIDVLMGETEGEIHPYTGDLMQRRLNVRWRERMWQYATFESTESERVPSAYYVPAALGTVIERLQAHGVRTDRLQEGSTRQVEEFRIESTDIAAEAFENHRERIAVGKYVFGERTLPEGTYRVPMDQPLARLAFYLLEPRSNDGFLTWNFLDDVLKDSKVYPILRTRN